MENKDKILTTGEAADELRLTRSGITKMFHNGEFPNAFKFGKSIRIPSSDIEALKQKPFNTKEAS